MGVGLTLVEKKTPSLAHLQLGDVVGGSSIYTTANAFLLAITNNQH